MNEQWTLEAEVLNRFARHYETGETMPEALISNLRQSQQFMSGWQTLRQQSFALLDMKFHMSDPSQIDDVSAFERETISPYTLMPYEGGCIVHSFSHIFAGGYSAGYYSYMWAEVLDADAFEAFKENGLYDRETADKFKTLLAKGGSEEPMDLYIAFRGREPNEAALFKRRGLTDTAEDKAA